RHARARRTGPRWPGGRALARPRARAALRGKGPCRDDRLSRAVRRGRDSPPGRGPSRAALSRFPPRGRAISRRDRVGKLEGGSAPLRTFPQTGCAGEAGARNETPLISKHTRFSDRLIAKSKGASPPDCRRVPRESIAWGEDAPEVEHLLRALSARTRSNRGVSSETGRYSCDSAGHRFGGATKSMVCLSFRRYTLKSLRSTVST